MLKIFTIFFLYFCFMANTLANSSIEAPPEILISAATSLKDVFQELGKNFEKKNKVKVLFNFAASGQLRAQIENGAPVDLFASASFFDINLLEKKDLLEKKSITNFIKNTLVLAQGLHVKKPLKNLEELSTTGIKSLALGNPESVPVGRYAKESLSYYKMFDSLKEKIIFGESARQVLDYIAKNEVDAGIVFVTDVISDKKVKTVFEFSEVTHSLIAYPIATIKSSKKIKEAKAFIEFIMSKESQQLFAKYGFVSIK